MNNAAYETWMKNIIPAFRNFRLEVLDMVEDTEQNKVAIWAKSSAETPVGPYANEYMLIFHMTEKGDKLVRMREFVDSAYSSDFFPKLNAQLAGKQEE